MCRGISCYAKNCTQNINNHCVAGYSDKVVCKKRKASFNAREYLKDKERCDKNENSK